MKHITTFNEASLNVCRTAIQAKLDELQAELGITVQMGRITYGTDSFSSKIETTITNGIDEYEIEYNRHVYSGLIQDGLAGIEFKKGITPYKFRGIRPRARNNPYIVENTTNGKLFRFSEEEVLQLIKMAHPKLIK